LKNQRLSELVSSTPQTNFLSLNEMRVPGAPTLIAIFDNFNIVLQEYLSKQRTQPETAPNNENSQMVVLT
jgi:hypothetical protein